MPRGPELLYAMNAGGVDKEALARVDLEKMRLAGEHPVDNFLPRVLGPMMIRPGSQNLVAIPDDDETRLIPFLKSTGDSYVLMLSPSEMRVMLNGAIQQIPSVSTTISSGSWSDVSTSPASATGGATLSFSATSTLAAKLRQSVSVAGGDQATAHILRVVVSAGPLYLRVGSSAGADDLVGDTKIDTGTHKIAFTPNTGTVYVELRAEDDVTRGVSQIDFEANITSGDLVLPTPWTTFADIERLRYEQSVDVMFVGDGTYQQRRIEHRGALSWSVALYKVDDGPFVLGSDKIYLTPDAKTGDVTITSSEAVFKSEHVGALIEITQFDKIVTQLFTGRDQTSDYVTTTGHTTGRYIQRTGVNTSSFTGTMVLERSLDLPEPIRWEIVLSYTDSAVAFTEIDFDDDLDGSVVHYRWRCTDYTSGSCTMTVRAKSDVQNGRARITAFNSATSVDAEVIRPFGNTEAARNWRLGDWSDARGWPRIPVIHDSRLHWFRKDTDYASFPDDYTNFDDEEEGDSAPLNRSVGTGGETGVVWAVSQDRLLAGTENFEAVILASELDEPLTPTAYTVRKPSRQGCADIPPAEHNDGVFFAQRSAKRLYNLAVGQGSARYQTQDISRLNPAAFSAGIVRMAMQRQPDTRLYCVMEDGSVTVLTYERDDEVVAITTFTIAGGLVEDVAVLPENDQDDIYLVVNRSGERYVERLHAEAEQKAVATCALLDGWKELTGSISSISGGTHFAGETVQVWADGQRRADVTLDGSGNASLGATYSRVVYGKRYYGTFKSVKLAYAAGLGTAVGQTKIVHGVGLILSNSCLDGIQIGRDASNLGYELDAYINGVERTANQLVEHFDQDITPINADWDADARFYIKVDSAEGPCTIAGVVIDIETRDGSAAG